MFSEHVRSFLIDEALGKRSNEPYTIDGLSATSVLSCIRLMWYFYNGMVEPNGDYLPNPSSIERLSDGYLHQDKFGETMRRMPNVDVEEEDTYQVVLGHIKARVDFRIKWNNVRYHIEFKSLGTNTFKMFQDNGVLAFPAYHAQTQIMAAGERETPLIFYAKNVETGEHIDELVKVDEDEVEFLLSVSEEFEKYKLEDSPPNRPYDISDTRCAGCPARMLCWFSQLREHVIYTTSISREETDKVAGLLKLVSENDVAARNYDFYYEALRDYILALHARYQRNRLSLRGVKSSVFDSTTTRVDRDRVKILLDRRDHDKVFYTESSQRQRMLIRWDEI